MKAENLRIGNYVKSDGLDCYINFFFGGQYVDLELIGFEYTDDNHEQKIEYLEPIPLTEEWLLKLGFIGLENESYCNKKQWTLQVTGNRYEDDNTINRDETWFDGIGDYSWLPNSTKPKTMVVNTLCRGNYVCNSVDSVHTLQNLYFALTGEELKTTL
jgi:hypothetical protein